MIYRLPIDPFSYERILKGLKRSHKVDNTHLEIQAGDFVYFRVNDDQPELTTQAIHVCSKNMAANWVTLCLVVMTTEDQRMGAGMTDRRATALNAFPKWQMEGYANEEDYTRIKELNSLISKDEASEKRGTRPSVRKRLEGFKQEREEIENRRNKKQ